LLLEAAKLTATHTKLLLFDPFSLSLSLCFSLHKQFGRTCKEETSAASIERKEFQSFTLRGFQISKSTFFAAHFGCDCGAVEALCSCLKGSKLVSFYFCFFFLSLTCHVGWFFSY